MTSPIHPSVAPRQPQCVTNSKRTRCPERRKWVLLPRPSGKRHRFKGSRSCQGNNNPGGQNTQRLATRALHGSHCLPRAAHTRPDSSGCPGRRQSGGLTDGEGLVSLEPVGPQWCGCAVKPSFRRNPVFLEPSEYIFLLPSYLDKYLFIFIRKFYFLINHSSHPELSVSLK